MNSKAQYPGGCVSEECIVSKFPGDYYQYRNNWGTTFHFAQTGQMIVQDPLLHLLDGVSCMFPDPRLGDIILTCR